MGAKTFEELRAWQCAAELSDRVVAICATPALQHDFKFRDQLRDAGEGAPRLIAEGFGRWGHREFARYLVMAKAEVMEVKNDLLALKRRRTLAPEVIAEALELADRTIRTIEAPVVTLTAHEATWHLAPGTAHSTRHPALSTGSASPITGPVASPPGP